MSAWLDIQNARKDGTRYLVKIKPRSFFNDHNNTWSAHWADAVFVALNRGNISAWQVAAPVGVGGFPDTWFVGYQEIPGVTDTGPWEPWSNRRD